MFGFMQEDYKRVTAIELTTPSGMRQSRELREVLRTGELYVAVSGKSETAVVDLLFYFDTADKAKAEWANKFAVDPALKASAVDYRSVVKHHSMEYFRDGSVMMH